MSSKPEELFAKCDEISQILAQRQLPVVRIDPLPGGLALVHKLPDPQIESWKLISVFVLKNASKIPGKVFCLQGFMAMDGPVKFGGCLQIFSSRLVESVSIVSQLLQQAPRLKPHRVSQIVVPPSGFYSPHTRLGGGTYEVRRNHDFSPQFELVSRPANT